MESITYLGKRIHPPRIKRIANQYVKESWLALKYRQAKVWAKWFAIRFTICLTALGLLATGYAVAAWDDSRTVSVQNIIAPIAAPIIDIEKAKTDMIHQLALRENHGGVPGYLDDNSRGSLPKKDKISYGVMAFKISTVQRFAKECQGVTLTNEQAVILAIDEAKAKDLAKCAIFDHNHLNEWSAATQEMFTTVKIINKLTK